MATVNQRIPNFLGGVSQQPDKIKFPGQLRVCDNAVPDITFGLKKRPAGEFVGVLSNATSNGFWYQILRDGDEKYLIQITPNNTTRPIRVWDIADGTEKSLTNSDNDSLYQYLSSGTSGYALQTIQDYTIIANPNKVVRKSTTTTDDPIHSGNYAYARLDTIAYNTEYILYHTTAPTPKTYFRVTSVKVDKIEGNNLVGPTWDANHDDSQHSGTLTWSFSGGTALNNTSNRTNCRDIEGSLQINGSAYIESNTANYQGNDSSDESKFLGYTQNYHTRYTATVTLTDGGLIRETNQTTAENKFIDVGIEGIPYRISVEAVEPVTTYEDVTGIAYFKTPKNPDNGPISMQTILNGLSSSVNSSLSNVTAEIIGSGLFLHGNNAPSVNFLGGAVNENMSVIGQKAQDISRLPAMCKQGYVAKVANTADLDTDDYYVKFEAENGVSGVGSWEECVRPHKFDGSGVEPFACTWAQSGNTVTITATGGQAFNNVSVGDNIYIDFGGTTGSLLDGEYTVATVATQSFTIQVDHSQTANGTIASSGLGMTKDSMITGFDPATMPHALINNRNGTFTFTKLDLASANGTSNYWKDREVGDNVSNPFPTFINSTIQKIFFHRNRLGLISGEQVVLSQPGQYFNFFIVSAIAASDDNPIDITVSDVKPAFINHILPIQKGLMMFSDNGQFLLFTESDIFSPKTARLKKIASYECDATIQPVDLGTSVLFTSNVSAYARAFEATILDDETPPKIIEQTRVVPEFLPKDITISSNSAAIGIVSYGKKGDTRIYHYKYYDAGNQREQSAWYSWTLTGAMHHIFYTSGSFFTVTFFENQYRLSRHEYVADANANRTYVLGGTSSQVGLPTSNARWFEPCLDFLCLPTAFSILAADANYPLRTELTLPFTPQSSNIFLVGLSGNDTQGNPVAGLVKKADFYVVGTNRVVFLNIGINNNAKVALGYKYTSTIELPTYYFNVGQNAYDLNGDLRISGINFELGVSGPMEFHLTSPFSYTDASGNVTKDIDDYVQYETGMLTTATNFNTVPSKLSKEVRVPIQRKNNKYNLQIKIPDPFSTALISASWDGIYNQKRHVRR